MRSAGTAVRVLNVARVTGGGRTAFIVELRNPGRRAVSDLPISVGVRGPHRAPRRRQRPVAPGGLLFRCPPARDRRRPDPHLGVHHAAATPAQRAAVRAGGNAPRPAGRRRRARVPAIRARAARRGRAPSVEVDAAQPLGRPPVPAAGVRRRSVRRPLRGRRKSHRAAPRQPDPPGRCGCPSSATSATPHSPSQALPTILQLGGAMTVSDPSRPPSSAPTVVGPPTPVTEPATARPGASG